MTIRTRLKRLEEMALEGPPKARRRLRGKPGRQGRAGRDQGPQTSQEWLARFEALGRAGHFDCEPEFPQALKLFRDAMARAHEANARPDPPADFLPGAEPERRRREWEKGSDQVWVQVDAEGNILPEGADVNRGLSRRVWRFPDLQEAWDWIAGMTRRRYKGVPPVAEAEYRELAGWLEANYARLDALLPSYVADLGWGTTSLWYLKLMMNNHGPRGTDAGELAEAVRRLRAQYGGQLVASD